MGSVLGFHPVGQCEALGGRVFDCGHLVDLVDG